MKYRQLFFAWAMLYASTPVMALDLNAPLTKKALPASTAKPLAAQPMAPASGVAPATALKPPVFGMQPAPPPAPMKTPAMGVAPGFKQATPSPAPSPAMTAPAPRGGIAGATSPGFGSSAASNPAVRQLTTINPALTRQIGIRTERFASLKREVERKRTKADADAARAKTENEKTRGAAALKARSAERAAAATAARNLEQFCTSGGDADGDGHVSLACTGGDDCDDSDAARFPGNPEFCDLLGHDEDCSTTTFGLTDGDGDGQISSACFNTAGGSVIDGPDCDDSRAEVHRGAAETCDLLDNNCDGRIDEGQTLPYYLDADSDGHGSRASRMNVCPIDVTRAADSRDAGGNVPPWVLSSDDCDDSNPGVWNAARGCQ